MASAGRGGERCRGGGFPNCKPPPSMGQGRHLKARMACAGGGAGATGAQISQLTAPTGQKSNARLIELGEIVIARLNQAFNVSTAHLNWGVERCHHRLGCPDRCGHRPLGWASPIAPAATAWATIPFWAFMPRRAQPTPPPSRTAPRPTAWAATPSTECSPAETPSMPPPSLD